MLDRGHEVTAMIRPESSLWRIQDLKGRMKIYDTGLLDLERLKKAMHDVGPEYIFHLATYGSYPRSQKDSLRMMQTNIIGTYNLLNASLDVPYKCFVNTGTSSEYGLKSAPMKEDDVLEPNSIYGVSKAAATMLCRNFAMSHGKNIFTFRPFSVYGYFEDRQRLFPEVIVGCISGNDVSLSDGKQKRDYLFIDDLIEAYAMAMGKKNIAGHVFNISSGIDLSVREIAETIRRLAGSDNRLLFGKREKQPFEAEICWRADISAAKKMIGWKPRTSLVDGVSRTIEWFRENMSLYSKA